MVTRRGLLLGGAGGAVALAGGGFGLIQAGVLPGKARLDRTLGGCDVPNAPPRSAAGPVVTGSFSSAACRRTVPFALAYPPGAKPGDRLPVCLVLHGYGANERSFLGGLELHRYLADAVAGTGSATSKVRPFVLAAPDGGPRYWHPRAQGDDSRAMLVDEFLPLLARRGLLADRIALLGHSMGGYGVLLFAQTWPGRVAGVVASSPAVWRSWSEAHRASPQAFDSADEWHRYDVLRGGGRLRGVPVRVDCGHDDWFAPNMPALRDALPDDTTFRLADGCHDSSFWRSVAPAELAFLGRALTA